MSKNEENTNILNRIKYSILRYFLYYWMVFLAIVGYLFYYFKDKKIFSRGLLKYIYILLFILYVPVAILSILFFLFIFEVTRGFTRPFA